MLLLRLDVEILESSDVNHMPRSMGLTFFPEIHGTVTVKFDFKPTTTWLHRH